MHTISDKVNLLKTARLAKYVGYGFGAASAFATIVEDKAAGNVTVGTAVKVGINIAATIAWGALGPVGLAYGILDLTVYISTGQSITDRIGQIVDEEIKKR